MIKLIAILNRYGLRVGTIKHDVHGFSIDKPGKDSYRHKAAGAHASVITSPTQIGMVADVDRDHSPEELVSMLPELDIVLAEASSDQNYRRWRYTDRKPVKKPPVRTIPT